MSISTVGDFTARVMNDGFVGTFKPYLDENHVWSGGDTLDPDFLPHSTLVRTEFADRTLTNDPAMTVRFTSGVELGKAPVNAIVEMCVYVDGSTPSSPSTWLPTRGFVRSSNSKPDLLSETGARISSVDEWCKSFGTGTSASQELGPAVVPPLVAPRMMYFVAVRLRGLFAPVPVAPRNGQP